MTDYIPTTEEVRNGYVIDPENPFFNSPADKRFAEEFDRWLAELKAQAWEEGAVWHRANAVPDDRRMKVRFVSELQAVNPYRQGEK